MLTQGSAIWDYNSHWFKIEKKRAKHNIVIYGENDYYQALAELSIVVLDPD
jgi:hypothetical protein